MQVSRKFPAPVLGLVSVLVSVCSPGPAAFPLAQAQTSSAAETGRALAFDTVSVKPNRTGDSHPGSMLRPDGFDAENTTPLWVMYWAFGQTARDPDYFSGLPDWARSERFDILAKVAGPDAQAWDHMSDAGKQRMIREILMDRFKLQFHHETRERPVYSLVVGKGGARLSPARPLPERPATATANGLFVRPDVGLLGYSRSGMVVQNMTMTEFAKQLSAMKLGRPVEDRTGLPGRYDFKLDFAAIAASATPPDPSAAAPEALPDIFTAIPEQLGLRLEPAKGMVEILVVDHMERPSPN